MKLDLNQKEDYKETELGLLPNEWEVKKLEDLVEFKNGLWKGKKGPFITVKVLRNTNFNNAGTINFYNIAELDVEKKQFETREIKKNDIILERSGGGPKQPVGRVVFFEKEDNFKYSFSNFTSRLRVINKDIIFPKYLFYFLFHFYIKGETNNYQNRTTGIRNLDFTRYKNILITLPPLSEQKKIAYVLSAVQEAKDKTEDVIKATKELKKSMMKHLFTYGPVSLEEVENIPLKETEIGLIPEEWEMKAFGNVGTFQYGYTESANENEIGPKFLRITDIDLDTNIINWATVPYCKIEEDRFANYSLNEGDILIARIGATTGKTCIIKNPPKSVFASYLIRFISNRDIIDPNFLFYYTEDYKYWRQIDAGKEGKLKKGVSSSQLKKFLLPVPSLLTQKKIASILSAIDQKIEAEESKKKALEDLFKSLLHNLMTAKIRVNHLENVFDG